MRLFSRVTERHWTAAPMNRPIVKISRPQAHLDRKPPVERNETPPAASSRTQRSHSIPIVSELSDKRHQRSTCPHPGPLPSNGRGRIFASLVLNPTVPLINELRSISQQGILID